MKLTESKLLWLVSGIVFLSRIPFLFDGYGSEEDAWALPLVAERIAESGKYEVSRLPGHPLQELCYAMIHNSGPVGFNLLTALFGTIAVYFFIRMLQNLQIPQSLLAGIALAFTPVIYINSTNAMDYIWALAFVMAAGDAIIKGKPLNGGILLGCAIACRITAGGMVLPYSILIWKLFDKNTATKKLLQFGFCTLLTTILLFIPVIYEYGAGFFKYYEHFPLPGFAKNAYKGTIGVWGFPGFILLTGLIIAGTYRSITTYISNYRDLVTTKGGSILLPASVTILIYTISFIQLPWKSAFLIPVVPFVIAVISLLSSRRTMYTLCVTLLFSCFFMGINLAEPHRGSKSSKVAIEFILGGQKIALDPLQGLVNADQSKRRQRTSFAKSVLEQTQNLHEKTVIIAGWWLADILVLEKQQRQQNKAVEYRYYCSTEEMQSLLSKGYVIYYLEDQAYFNDLRFKQHQTLKLAKKLEIKS